MPHPPLVKQECTALFVGVGSIVFAPSTPGKAPPTPSKAGVHCLVCGGRGSLFMPHPPLVKQECTALFAGVAVHYFCPIHSW